MKTDVDTALEDIADFYIKNRRSMNEPELEAILQKHCVDAKEIRSFTTFLGTEPGQLRFKTHLRERKESSTPKEAPARKEPWQMTLEEYAYAEAKKYGHGKPRMDWIRAGYGEAYRSHKTAVQRALKEGKPVPPEVLKDYPELAKTVTPTAIPYQKVGNPGTLVEINKVAKSMEAKGYLTKTPRVGENRYELWVIKKSEAAKVTPVTPEVNPWAKSSLPKEVSDILLTEPVDMLFEKFNLPSGRGMPRTPEQSKRLVDLGLKANWGAGQVALTYSHPAWKVVIALEDMMNDEEFAEYVSQKKGFEPQVEKPSYLETPQIPKTRVTSLGIDLELPVARAVESLVEENPWSSGFHGALNQRWAIVFRGKISDRAVNAAKAAGLEVSYREAPKGSGQILTDVSLPSVGVSEIEKATEVFNRFAELYEGTLAGTYHYKEETQARTAKSYAEGLGYRTNLQYRNGEWELTVEKTQGGSTSYLKEAVAETECQIISPQYYDILTWLGIPVPDYSFTIEPEVKDRKIDEVLQKLKDGVASIHDSAIFRDFLLTMSKFHQYSIGNQILIMIQRRDATRVAGFNTWKDLGRYVKAGERGIAILAPCLPPKGLMCPICGQGFTEQELRRHLPEVHQRTDVSSLIREAREGAAVPTPTYFKVVYVFDVSQTEGKALPEIAVPVLSGAFSKELYDKLMALASKHSLAVSFEPRPELDPAIKGMLLGKEIWVKGDEPEAQRLKTLAHEEAHYFTENVYFIPHAAAEVIAESVAFVVGAHFGFDSGIRSFPYVALWAKETKVLEQNLASIRKISGRMIEEVGG